MLTRAAIAADIEGILQLQALNLYSNLSETDRAAGFVTTPFTVAQIEQLLAETGVFVAEDDNGKIVGYAFAGSWAFFSQWPIFPYMVSRFPLLKFQDTPITETNSFQYGPVCIDRSLRGSGILLQLFATMRSGMADRYPIGVTFINKINPRSVAAHTRKLDLTIVDEFEFNQNFYYGLAFGTIG